MPADRLQGRKIMGKKKWGTDGPISLVGWLSRKRIRLQDWAVATGVASYSEVIDSCNSLGVLAPSEEEWRRAVPASTVPEEGIVVVTVGTEDETPEAEDEPRRGRRKKKSEDPIGDANLCYMSSKLVEKEVQIEGVRGSRIPLDVVKDLWTRRLEGIISGECEAYITDVLSRVQPEVDLSRESLVLRYFAAYQSGDFHKHQVLADWILRSGVVSRNLLDIQIEIGVASYRSLYHHCPTWTVFHELSGCLPRITKG